LRFNNKIEEAKISLVTLFFDALSELLLLHKSKQNNKHKFQAPPLKYNNHY